MQIGASFTPNFVPFSSVVRMLRRLVRSRARRPLRRLEPYDRVHNCRTISTGCLPRRSDREADATRRPLWPCVLKRPRIVAALRVQLYSIDLSDRKTVERPSGLGNAINEYTSRRADSQTFLHERRR